jgi:hypothetical protein
MKISDLIPIEESSLKKVLKKIADKSAKTVHDTSEENLLHFTTPKSTSKLGQK